MTEDMRENTEEIDDLSLLAKFDHLYRSYDVNGCDTEFLEFTLNQEACRIKWLATVKEMAQIQSKINEVNKANSKVELQLHHVGCLLRDEIRARTKVQEEKRTLEKRLDNVRDFLSTEDNIDVNIKEKLSQLSTRKHHPQLSYNIPTRLIEKLDTISEAETTDSLLAAIGDNGELEEEELELSGLVRSYRELSRNKKHFAEDAFSPGEVFKRQTTMTSTPICEGFDESGTNQIIATTTVIMSPDGQAITASTKIETHGERGMEMEVERDTSNATDEFREILQHSFQRQTIVSISDHCTYCDTRIKFGHPALKCINCDTICHVVCGDKVPKQCMPKMKKACAHQKKNPGTPIKFFPSPSTKN